MGVTRPFLTVVEGEPTGNDTTWSATQVGPRRVEACLGGQDDGASGVDVGSKTDRSSYQNGDDGQCPILQHSAVLQEREMKTTM